MVSDIAMFLRRKIGQEKQKNKQTKGFEQACAIQKQPRDTP
jgi:hypothetical protein